MGIGGLFRQGEFHNAVAVEEQIGVDRLPVAILIIDVANKVSIFQVIPDDRVPQPGTVWMPGRTFSPV